MTAGVDAVDRTIATLEARLLACRTDAGHWEGRLASSALSTATAAIALTLAARSDRAPASIADRGFEWLAANQNDDGGWGDTVVSFSNLSTTALCWAALTLDPRPTTARRAAAQAAEAWLLERAGSLDADHLSAAVLARYGKDRTFSAPILTVLALAGRLGRNHTAWRVVPQLPFELAAFPHRWFQFLRLPVVSYALPALVAIGQARHARAPTRNLALRAIRSALVPRTLALLEPMQPASGGYLEATPLTSFVVMSLIAAGRPAHPVVAHGIRFLVDSVRADGSWPIDTNLATWVTTLSTSALSGKATLNEVDRTRIADWLIAQQTQTEHPYTHAALGGWAWTDRAGGVPDADDTAGALLALHTLAATDARARLAAAAGIQWLLDVQNRDGGIPTFCRGWGALAFDRSAPDLTAHALRAWSRWQGAIGPALEHRAVQAGRRAMRYLARCQRPDGSWAPLWFGNQHVHEEINFTYGTSRVVLGLADDRLVRQEPDADRLRQHGINWLLAAQRPDGGWGGAPGAPSSIEETGLALEALATSAISGQFVGRTGFQVRRDANQTSVRATGDIADAARRAAGWIVGATDEGTRTPASPIGLYFARLWYFEELYPLVFGLAGLSGARRLLSA